MSAAGEGSTSTGPENQEEEILARQNEVLNQAAALKDLQGVVEQIKRFKIMYNDFQRQIDELKGRSLNATGTSRSPSMAGGARRGGSYVEGPHGTADFSGITNGAEGNQEKYGGYMETGANVNDIQQGGGDEYGAADGGYGAGAAEYDTGEYGTGEYDAGEYVGDDGAGEYVGDDGAGEYVGDDVGVGGIQEGGAPVAKKVKKSTKTKKTKTKKAKKAVS
jgi:hypothetical protein